MGKYENSNIRKLPTPSVNDQVKLNVSNWPLEVKYAYFLKLQYGCKDWRNSLK